MLLRCDRRWLMALLLLATTAQAEPARVDFAREIQPILSDNCYFCHGPDANAREADLRLDQREAALAPRAGHAIIAPGKSQESELLKRLVATDDDTRMPPPKSNRKLTAEQIELIRRWIDEGAEWGQHWSFVPPRRPALPSIQDVAWSANPIDRFLAARLEREKLATNPPAEKATLARRVTLDLTGLPPTPAEVAAFVSDASPDAYERLVDRLLASPRYGERMVWDWLDAARYADTNGYQGDQTRTMWPWRDWAARALNENMPFDRFTVEQLAGDQLPNATLEQQLATGFCRNHMINGEGGRIAEENRVEYVFDQLETTATVWLAATFNCCRCHDHKFDPFTKRDYYGLFGFFNNTPVNGGNGSGQTPPLVEYITAEDSLRRDQLQQKVNELAAAAEQAERSALPREEGKTSADAEKAATLTDELKNKLKLASNARSAADDTALFEHFKTGEPALAAALNALREAKQTRDGFNAAIPRVMVMEDQPQPRETVMFDKGIYSKPQEKVTTATPASLTKGEPSGPLNRLALAQWLVSADHPLTARVAVNRAWQQFFGVGIVKTSDDFGVQGEEPSHPELLDWLAVEFRESGWDVKRLQRLIVTSSAYRQSSHVTPELAERDPQNRLLARGPRHRLPAFMLRDQALAASGLLVEKIGGPGVNPYQPEGVWEDTSFGTIRYTQDHGEKLYRRSVYTFWRRIIAPTLFFDSATRQFCTVKQLRTNTPLHALATLNDITFVEAARQLAERAMQAAATPEERITQAFRLVLAREPNAAELQLLLASLERQRVQFAADNASALALLAIGEQKRNEQLNVAEQAALTGVCLAIFNLDEALCKE